MLTSAEMSCIHIRMRPPGNALDNACDRATPPTGDAAAAPACAGEAWTCCSPRRACVLACSRRCDIACRYTPALLVYNIHRNTQATADASQNTRHSRLQVHTRQHTAVKCSAVARCTRRQSRQRRAGGSTVIPCTPNSTTSSSVESPPCSPPPPPPPNSTASITLFSLLMRSDDPKSRHTARHTQYTHSASGHQEAAREHANLRSADFAYVAPWGVDEPGCE